MGVDLAREVTNQVVMEYSVCGSVDSHLLNGNCFTEDEIREIACCCLLGLEHLHNHDVTNGVIHCEWF